MPDYWIWIAACIAGWLLLCLAIARFAGTNTRTESPYEVRGISTQGVAFDDETDRDLYVPGWTDRTPEQRAGLR